MTTTNEQLKKDTEVLESGALPSESVVDPHSPTRRSGATATPRPRLIVFVDPDHGHVPTPASLGMEQDAFEAQAALLGVAHAVPSRNRDRFEVVSYVPGERGDTDGYRIPLDVVREMGVGSVIGGASGNLRNLEVVQVGTAGGTMARVGLDCAGTEVLRDERFAGGVSGIDARLGPFSQVDWARFTNQRVKDAADQWVFADVDTFWAPGPRVARGDLAPEAAAHKVPNITFIQRLVPGEEYAAELVDAGTQRVADRLGISVADLASGGPARGSARTAETLGVHRSQLGKSSASSPGIAS